MCRSQWQEDVCCGIWKTLTTRSTHPGLGLSLFAKKNLWIGIQWASSTGNNATRDEGHQNSVHKVALTSSWNVMALVRLSSYNQVLTRDTIEEHLYIPVNILHRPRALAFLPTPCYGDSPLHALRMQSGKHWRPRHRGSSPNTSVPPSIDSQPLDLSPSPHHR